MDTPPSPASGAAPSRSPAEQLQQQASDLLAANDPSTLTPEQAAHLNELTSALAAVSENGLAAAASRLEAVPLIQTIPPGGVRGPQPPTAWAVATSKTEGAYSLALPESSKPPTPGSTRGSSRRPSQTGSSGAPPQIPLHRLNAAADNKALGEQGLPGYCGCGGPAIPGECMLACDSVSGCPSRSAEGDENWWHLDCVGRTDPPGENEKWYCPLCTQGR